MRAVRGAEALELVEVLLQGLGRHAAGEVVALLALRPGTAHRRALLLAVVALQLQAAPGEGTKNKTGGVTGFAVAGIKELATNIERLGNLKGNSQSVISGARRKKVRVLKA